MDRKHFRSFSKLCSDFFCFSLLTILLIQGSTNTPNEPIIFLRFKGFLEQCLFLFKAVRRTFHRIAPVPPPQRCISFVFSYLQFPGSRIGQTWVSVCLSSVCLSSVSLTVLSTPARPRSTSLVLRAVGSVEALLSCLGRRQATSSLLSVLQVRPAHPCLLPGLPRRRRRRP